MFSLIMCLDEIANFYGYIFAKLFKTDVRYILIPIEIQKLYIEQYRRRSKIEYLKYYTYWYIIYLTL